MIGRGIIALGAALAACTSSAPVGEVREDVTPNAYLGVQTALLEGDLVNFAVRMRGVDFEAELTDYAECAAAQYALIRGFGFARAVRTTFDAEGDVLVADAVYTISDALPAGSRTIDATVTVDACRVAGIPTV